MLPRLTKGEIEVLHAMVAQALDKISGINRQCGPESTRQFLRRLRAKLRRLGGSP